jgi:hypothetical protein
MKRSEMSDADFGKHLVKAYDAAAAACDADDPDHHPMAAVNKWTQQAKDGLAPVTTISEDDADLLEAEGDPTTPGGNRAHGKTAVDSAVLALDAALEAEILQIQCSGNDARRLRDAHLRHQEAWHRMHPGNRRATAALIDGYDRLK